MEVKPKPRRRWYRFSLRTMLVLVTLVCISLSGWRAKNWVDARRTEFIGRKNLNQGGIYWTLTVPVNTPKEDLDRHFKYQREVNAYRNKLFLKYQVAAKYPWLSVEPDPPEPVEPLLDYGVDQSYSYPGRLMVPLPEVEYQVIHGPLSE